MMKRVKLMVAAGAMILLSSAAMATDEPQNKSAKGTWVIETNEQNPNLSIIRIYNAQNEVVYEEQVKGNYIYANKKLQRKLNKLQEALTSKQLISKNLL
jgi:outer membrane biogenesis lipoprotein LolB